MPTISIIVPVYKVEPYLRRCVDSILAQSFTDYELILVDDGSPDNCGAICDEYASKDSRVQVIHKENGGLASARNAGIEIAIGRFILFCDSDDYVQVNWCRNLIECMEKNEHSFVFGGTRLVHVSGNETVETLRAPANEQMKWTLQSFISLHIDNYVGYAWNVLYDLSIIKKHTIRFPLDRVVEDLYFNFKYLEYVDSLVFTGESNYNYFLDERPTLSRKYYPESFKRWQEKYADTEEFIQRHFSEPEKTRIKEMVATAYLFPFLSVLENSFDKRNKKGVLQKICYNMSVVRSVEFQDCLQYADSSKENRFMITLLRHQQYFLVFLVQRLSGWKKMLRRKKA